jgi:hypothetical protein
MPKLVLHDLHAAPIADLDAAHGPWLCAACDEDATYLLCGVWRDMPAGYPPPEVIPDPFIKHVHSVLGTNFDFTSCEQHVAGWGKPGGSPRVVPIPSSKGVSIMLRFTRMF